MGAKTAMLAFTDGDLRPALLGATRGDPAEAAELVREVHPLDGTTFKIIKAEKSRWLGSVQHRIVPPARNPGVRRAKDTSRWRGSRPGRPMTQRSSVLLGLPGGGEDAEEHRDAHEDAGGEA
jgi:hypothetical protein